MRNFMIMALTVCTVSLLSCNRVEKEQCEKDPAKKWEKGQCVPIASDSPWSDSAYYTITNLSEDTLIVGSGPRTAEGVAARLKPASDGTGCVKVTRAQMDTLRITVSSLGAEKICDYEMEDRPCLKGNMELKEKDSVMEVLPAHRNENCKQKLG